MGYRSEVALAVRRTDGSCLALDTLWWKYLGTLPDEVRDVLKQDYADDIDVTPDRWFMHLTDIKWYAASLVGGSKDDLYADVDALDNWRLHIIKCIENGPDNYALTFIRIGEELGDVDQESWGNRNTIDMWTSTYISGPEVDG